jgi:23S rRNA (cytidine1920-2'-O)/16S rRNA (cytidine1409-2'-O)-methyltransferase
LVSSREAARREIDARNVLVGGAFADKPARMVDPGDSIELTGPPPRYVSRAGLKLEAALEAFSLDPAGLHCLDAGSSTGGFTDCLLQQGAASVVAVDVGTNQLHERIRADRRVDVREQTDIRSVTPIDLDPLVDLVVGDLSFISLRLVLPALASLIAPEGTAVLLVKPQFEAGKTDVDRGRGVITDPEIWRRVLDDVVAWATAVDWGATGIAPSPITGSKGNVEFIMQLQPGRPTTLDQSAIDAAVIEVAGPDGDQQQKGP